MGKLCRGLSSKQVWAVTAVIFIFALSGSALRAYAQDTGDAAPTPAMGNSTDEAQAEREEFVKEIRRVENLNKKYTQEIQDIRGVLADKDADYQNACRTWKINWQPSRMRVLKRKSWQNKASRQPRNWKPRPMKCSPKAGYGSSRCEFQGRIGQSALQHG